MLACVLENLPAEDLGERRSVPGPGIEPTHLPSSSDDDDRSTIEPLILRVAKVEKEKTNLNISICHLIRYSKSPPNTK